MTAISLAEMQALTVVYGTRHMWSTLQRQCDRFLRGFGEEPACMFWRAFSGVLAGNVVEGMRDLERLRDYEECGLAALLALVYAHKLAKFVDQDAVDEYEAQYSIRETTSTPHARLLCAQFHWLNGDPDQGRMVVDDLLERERDLSAPFQASCWTLRGWMELTSKKTQQQRKAIGSLDKSLQLDDRPRHQLLTLFGKAMALSTGRKPDFEEAMNLLIQIAGHFPRFEPAHTARAILCFRQGNWSLAMDMISSVLSLDPQSIEASRIRLLYYLTNSSETGRTTVAVEDLKKSIETREPKNAVLFHRVGQLVGRLADSNREILIIALQLVERAHALQPSNASFLIELGYLRTLMGDYPRAKEAYNEASELEGGSLEAMVGSTLCQFKMGLMEDALEQLELLNDTQDPSDRIPMHSYVCALAARLVQGDAAHQEILSFLNDALSKLFRQMHGDSIGEDLYVRFNPQMLLQILQEIMNFLPTEPLSREEATPKIVLEVLAVVEKVVELIPGILRAQVIFARCLFVANKFDLAKDVCRQCITADPRCGEAYLLLVQIFFFEEQFPQAQQVLEQALANDFSLEEKPLFKLLQARLCTVFGDLHKARALLESEVAALTKAAAIAAATTKRGAPPLPPSAKGRGGSADITSVPVFDRVSIFLELASILNKMKSRPEAAKIIQDALDLFGQSRERGRVVIANAQASLERGDHDAALSILRTIDPNSPYYLHSRRKMADIYLVHKNDRRSYTRTYQELAESAQTAESFLVLGEAFMSIQEPERAIQEFERALELNPTDVQLASKIGRALTSTHDFGRALQYYEHVVKQSQDASILVYHDLIELLLLLERYEDAEAHLQSFLSRTSESGGEDVHVMKSQVQCFLLMARVHKEVNNMEEAAKNLSRAQQIQNSIISSFGMQSRKGEGFAQEHKTASKITFELGQHFEHLKRNEEAISYYRKTLEAVPDHKDSMLSLARIYMKMGSGPECESMCHNILRIDPANDEATLMLADFLHRKSDQDGAINLFRDILEARSNNYVALVNLVRVARRVGQLNVCTRYFRLAARSSPSAESDPGLLFAKGLYHKFTGNPSEALENLAKARRDPEWRVACIEPMFDIYVNPDNDLVWKMKERATDLSPDERDSLESARKLITEFPARESPEKHRILEGYFALAHRTKSSTEEALEKFINVYKENKQSVSAIVGMALAFMMQKNPNKAKNQLKQIKKLEYSIEDADQYEKGYLLLAEIYSQNGKIDMAIQQVDMALRSNRSCAKAWEMLGMLSEKEHSFQDAADCYENAWNLEHEKNPAVGFKLAFNYLKAQRYVSAIDICHQVLSRHPDYPKMRKEILDRARSSLRP